MSIPNLPINFKDDILAATNPKRKYNLIQNDDGTVSFEDATEYQQTGSDFGAGQINATNDAINKIYSERILSLEEAALVTETGFFVDAMVVSELIGNLPESASYSGGEYYIAGDANNWQGTGFQTKIFDDIGLTYVEDSSTYHHAFRVPKAGAYKIDIYMDFSPANIPDGRISMYGRILKNKTEELMRESFQANRYQGIAYSFLVRLESNDLVSFEMLHATTGTSFLLGDKCRFNIIKL